MASAVGGVGSWIVVTVRVTTEIWFHLDPVETGPAVAPSNSILPGIQGERGALEVLTGWPGIWSGTGPISYAYAWYLDGSPISGATTSTYTDPDGLGVLRLRVTATGTSSVVAWSQPLAAA